MSAHRAADENEARCTNRQPGLQRGFIDAALALFTRQRLAPGREGRAGAGAAANIVRRASRNGRRLAQPAADDGTGSEKRDDFFSRHLRAAAGRH